MGRKQEQEAARKEKNALAELCRVQRKFIPDLFDLFGKTADPRNHCYITYPNRIMLGQMYFKGIAGIVSMQGMTQAFNDKKVSSNLSNLMGCGKWKYLPHHVTENEYLERLDPGELEEVIWQTVYSLIRRRSFEDAKYKKSVFCQECFLNFTVGIPFSHRGNSPVFGGADYASCRMRACSMR